MSAVIRSILLGLLISGCVSESEQARREAVFWQYFEAVSENDVGAALSLHAPEPEFLIPGQSPIVGTEPIRGLLQWDSVLGSRVRFEEGQWAGDTLTLGAGVERNSWFRGIGLDSIQYAPGTRIVFEGDRIKGVYPSSLNPRSAEEFDARFGEFMGWAQENAPELAELAPGGQFRYDRQSAERWLEVLNRYRH